MSNGNEEGLKPATKTATIPEEYLAFARWLYSHAQVIEVTAVIDDLPEVATQKTTVILDSGVWFLCRADLPMIDEDAINFVRAVE